LTNIDANGKITGRKEYLKTQGVGCAGRYGEALSPSVTV
jgi:hypothetical protein